jgi:hypothetical protein
MIAVIAIMIAVIVTMIAVIVIVIAIEIVIAAGVIVIVTDKSWIVLNPALAGFFFQTASPKLRRTNKGERRISQARSASAACSTKLTV